MILAIVIFLVFLFVFYTLAKEDFVFLRRNVSIDQLFDAIFLGLPAIVLFARLGYILFHPKWSYLNPLVFFIIPYYPGLAVEGGILGAVIFLYFYTKNKKIPTLRFVDELGLAFLATSSIYFLILSIEQGIGRHLIAVGFLVMGIFYLIAYILSRIVFAKERWVDGTVGALAIVFQSLYALLYAISMIVITRKVVISLESIVVLAFLVISLGIFMRLLLLPQKGK